MSPFRPPANRECTDSLGAASAWLRRAGLLVAAATALMGCDLGSAPGPSQTCREAGMQCTLPEGPLGVCERTTCPSGTSAPCFRCTPQH
jgi:hypothetical protein